MNTPKSRGRKSTKTTTVTIFVITESVSESRWKSEQRTTKKKTKNGHHTQNQNTHAMQINGWFIEGKRFANKQNAAMQSELIPEVLISASFSK
jgi:N-acetylneuraminic acid mutarotase